MELQGRDARLQIPTWLPGTLVAAAAAAAADPAYDSHSHEGALRGASPSPRPGGRGQRGSSGSEDPPDALRGLGKLLPEPLPMVAPPPIIAQGGG